MDMQTIWTITGLAAVDMVNPCTLAVQVLLLSALVLTKGRKDAILGGILFTATIYVTYLLYGLGILTAIYALGIQDALQIVLKALVLIMAVIELAAFMKYKPGFVALEMPMQFRPIAQKLLKSVENPWMAIPVAVLCSILLLPCSSGPYLSAIIYLATTTIDKLFYLLYYNAIFVLPMVGITLLIGLGTKPEAVMIWRNKHVRELHLLAGLLLLGVFFMV